MKSSHLCPLLRLSALPGQSVVMVMCYSVLLHHRRLLPARVEIRLAIVCALLVHQPREGLYTCSPPSPGEGAIPAVNPTLVTYTPTVVQF